MNRQIKFRGKRADNGEWVYGYLMATDQILVWQSNGNGEQWQVVPETIGQFTGLLDKDGKEIYEGDILESRPVRDVQFEVCYGWNTDGNSYGWCLKSYWHTFSMDKCAMKMEIIGNIYSNP